MTLVGVARYRVLTGDADSTDGDVADALVSGQLLVEEYLRRPLETAERTETLIPDSGGYLYPTAHPITEVPDGYTLTGGAVSSGQFVSALWLVGAAAISFTYTGGYSTSTLPERLAWAIARTAYERLRPTLAPVGAAVGARTAVVGDVSVTYGTEAPAMVPADVQYEIRGYRRRFL